MVKSLKTLKSGKEILGNWWIPVFLLDYGEGALG